METPVDFVVSTSPILGDFAEPVFKGIPLFSGLGQAGVVEEIHKRMGSVLGVE